MVIGFIILRACHRLGNGFTIQVTDENIFIILTRRKQHGWTRRKQLLRQRHLPMRVPCRAAKICIGLCALTCVFLYLRHLIHPWCVHRFGCSCCQRSSDDVSYAEFREHLRCFHLDLPQHFIWIQCKPFGKFVQPFLLLEKRHLNFLWGG